MPKLTLTLHNMSETEFANVIEALEANNLLDAHKEEGKVVNEVVTSSAEVTKAPVNTVITPVTQAAPVTQQTQGRTLPAETNDNELDIDGIPWDETIHAGTKNKNKDGRWKRKKGVSDDEYARGVASLQIVEKNKARQAGNEPVNVSPQATVAQPVQQAPVQQPVQQPINAAPPQASPVQQPVQTTQAVPTARDFNGLFTECDNLFQQGIVDVNYTDTIVNRINTAYPGANVTTISDIMGNDAYIAYGWSCIDVDAEARKAQQG